MEKIQEVSTTAFVGMFRIDVSIKFSKLMISIKINELKYKLLALKRFRWKIGDLIKIINRKTGDYAYFKIIEMPRDRIKSLITVRRVIGECPWRESSKDKDGCFFLYDKNSKFKRIK